MKYVRLTSPGAFAEEGVEFLPETGRYHLFVAAACPWAQRTLITRELKGLEDAISCTIAHPTWRKTRPNDVNDTHCGWVFGAPKGSEDTFTNTNGLGGPFPCRMDGCEPNPFFASV
jgi:glutathionyl-hydroquinone reductase